MSAGGVHRLLYGRRAHHRRKRRGRAGLRVRLDAPAVLRTLHSWCPVACLACSCAWVQCLAHNPFSHCFSVCAHDACQIKGKKHFFSSSCIPACCALCVSRGAERWTPQAYNAAYPPGVSEMDAHLACPSVQGPLLWRANCRAL